ncbi:MAG: hypothetical protein ACI81A_002019, partial [Paraglaciecola sp.]
MYVGTHCMITVIKIVKKMGLYRQYAMRSHVAYSPL